MRKPSHHTYRLTCLILALAGLLGGIAWPGHSRGQQLTDQTTIPLASNPSWVATGSLNDGREAHTTTLLPDGKVLVAGGGGYVCVGALCAYTNLNTEELYDPATGTWRYTGNSLTGNGPRRTGHTATLLPT